jgi:D-alanyl-D-alanine carboxypeptidase/D-alanyl-D-alanine-endopeptidase (penicillin-binding protein 4)
MIIELFSGSVLGVWLKTAGWTEPLAKSAAGWSTSILQPADTQRDQVIDAYLARLKAQGFDPVHQGLWLQTDRDLLVNHGGQRLYTPASLTKVATTLAALKIWGPNHRFKLNLSATGPLQNGVLMGDLCIQGDGDPLVITPEVIAIGKQLNRLGIRRVTGNLVVSGSFAVNFMTDLQSSGEQIKALWSAADVPIAIEGAVLTDGATVPLGQPLYTYTALPLVDVLKFMNVYSSNAIAEWLTDQMGGPEVIQQAAIQTGRIAPPEILIKNGSGLGQENQISPRAVVGLFQGIQAEIQPYRLTLNRLFPMMGQDQGTLEKRAMPKAAVVKTGTLWNTSGLAGFIPTRRYGPVWFAVMNRGDDYTDGFRSAQDRLLQSLVQHWGQDGTEAVPPMASDRVEGLRRKRLDRFMQNDFLSH